MGISKPLIVRAPSSSSETHLFYLYSIVKKPVAHWWVINGRTIEAKYCEIDGLIPQYTLRLAPHRYVYEADLNVFFILNMKESVSKK
ncbi:hypothetical protein C9J47_19820 [Photobacterium indicum]|jgi:hypothetical protein|uniref:Uncharacterized protein n=1 Tax=Photobacterium indicum TaxID=81447 RepID=A0A2T3L4G1_9GAMM|nr:hypothetical protein C9J47_19820 [Photobacterium indicum]